MSMEQIPFEMDGMSLSNADNQHKNTFCTTTGQGPHNKIQNFLSWNCTSFAAFPCHCEFLYKILIKSIDFLQSFRS